MLGINFMVVGLVHTSFGNQQMLKRLCVLNKIMID